MAQSNDSSRLASDIIEWVRMVLEAYPFGINAAQLARAYVTTTHCGEGSYQLVYRITLGALEAWRSVGSVHTLVTGPEGLWAWGPLPHKGSSALASRTARKRPTTDLQVFSSALLEKGGPPFAYVVASAFRMLGTTTAHSAKDVADWIEMRARLRPALDAATARVAKTRVRHRWHQYNDQRDSEARTYEQVSLKDLVEDQLEQLDTKMSGIKLLTIGLEALPYPDVRISHMNVGLEVGSGVNRVWRLYGIALDDERWKKLPLSWFDLLR